MKLRSSFLAGVALLCHACGSVSADVDARPPGPDAATAPDAAAIDAGRADASPPPVGQETVTGSGRLTGPTFQLDVQIGHPYEQAPTGGATRTLQGNSVVKP